MKRGLEVREEEAGTVLDRAFSSVGGLGSDVDAETMLYFGEVTEGLEFIAARELKSKLARQWTDLGGKTLTSPPSASGTSQDGLLMSVDGDGEPKSSSDEMKMNKIFDEMVHYQDGGGLVYFRLPHPRDGDQQDRLAERRREFLGGLLTVETVFLYVDHTSGLPQDASGLDAIERFVTHTTDAAKWDRALLVWQHNHHHNPQTEESSEVEHSTSTSSSSTATSGSAASSSTSSTSSAFSASSASFAPLFRCSCRRRGDQPWPSQEAAGSIGAGLVERFPHWKVSLQRYELEVYGYVNRDLIVLGVSLSSRPTDGNSNAAGHPGGRKKRRRRKGFVMHLGKTALSPTIANSLILLADVKPGQVVMDPFCGVGTIPIHVTVIEPQAIVLGADRATSEVHKTIENIKMYMERIAPARPWIDVVQWDVRRLPMPSASVDVVISDLPFGIRSGSTKNNHVLYPLAVNELARVTRPNGKAILITADEPLMTDLVTNKATHLWRTLLIHNFLMGLNDMRITLYMLERLP